MTGYFVTLAYNVPMGHILAIETSTDAGSVALLSGAALVQLDAPPSTPHSAWVLPAVRQLMAEAGLRLEQLDAIAFGSGPGSFTGLRLACGIAQGLALGAGLPVVPVCSLEALARAAGRGRVWVGIDARMSEMYFAAYTVGDDGIETLIEPACAPPEQVDAPAGSGWLAAGSAFAAYGDILLPRFSAVASSIEPTAIARAADVAQIGAAQLARGLALDAALAAPLYVRDKVALTTAERMARGGRA